jgi:hypothetical protein
MKTIPVYALILACLAIMVICITNAVVTQPEPTTPRCSTRLIRGAQGDRYNPLGSTWYSQHAKQPA